MVTATTPVSSTNCRMFSKPRCPTRNAPPWMNTYTGRRRRPAGIGVVTSSRRQSSSSWVVVSPGSNPAGCGQFAGSWTALRTADQDLGGLGGAKRRAPVGGAAYGMPRNCRANPVAAPRTQPDCVRTTSGLADAALAEASSSTSPATEALTSERRPTALPPRRIKSTRLERNRPNSICQPCRSSRARGASDADPERGGHRLALARIETLGRTAHAGQLLAGRRDVLDQAVERRREVDQRAYAAGTPPSTFSRLPVLLPECRSDAKCSVASAMSSGRMLTLSVLRWR